MELDRLAEASPMPRRRVAFADLSNSAERVATRKKPVARTAAPSPSIPLPSPSPAASSNYPPWTRCFDPRYKYHYWYNHATGVSTWTEPDEAWVDEHHPPAAAEDGDFWASWFDGDADEAIRQEAAARTAEAERSEKRRNEVRDRIVRSAAAPAAVAAVAAVAYCRRYKNAGTKRACKPLQLLQARFLQSKTRVRRFCGGAPFLQRTRRASVTPHRLT